MPDGFTVGTVRAPLMSLSEHVPYLQGEGFQAVDLLYQGGEVLVHLGLYSAVYFLIYLTPADHIRSSFTRIAAALVPLGLWMLGAMSSRVRLAIEIFGRRFSER